MKETVPKCDCLVDFFATSLLAVHAYTHAHPCSLFETGKNNQSLYIEKMLIVCSSQLKYTKVDFLC